MGRYRQHPAPGRVGNIPAGRPAKSNEELFSFTLPAIVSSTPGPVISTHDVYVAAAGIRVENYSSNSVAVVFGSAGANEILRSHDMLIPPYSLATRPYSGSMVSVGRMPNIAALQASSGQGVKVSFSRQLQPEQVLALPQMGPASTAQPRPPTSFQAPASRTYAVRRYSYTAGQSGYLSDWLPAADWPPDQITGEDLWVDSSSPGLVSFALVPMRGVRTVPAPAPSGALTPNVDPAVPPDTIQLPAGGFLSLALTLDPTADIWMQAAAAVGTYTGQILIKGY